MLTIIWNIVDLNQNIRVLVQKTRNWVEQPQNAYKVIIEYISQNLKPSYLLII